MKITKTFIDGATHALCTRAFNDRFAESTARRRAIGVAIYEHLYPEAMRGFMREAPDGAFQRTSQIHVRGVGRYTRILLPENTPVYAAHQYGAHLEDCSDEDRAFIEALLVEYDAEDDAYNAIQEERDELARKIRGVLAAVTTTNKLFQVWPECVDVLAPLVNDGPTANLPAVVPQELNAELKLP